MASEFSREFFSANRIVKADLHCARQPREQDLDKIKAELKSLYDATEVLLDVSVDESLLSGYVLQVGDRVFDNSGRHALDQMTGDKPDLATLKTRVEDYKPAANTAEGGTVVSAADGIVTVEGMDRAVYGEIVTFENGAKGMVESVEPSHLGIMLFDGAESVGVGTLVTRTGKRAGIPVGEAFLGRVINPLGEPIDGKGAIEAVGYNPIEKQAPGILERQSVDTPLHTGILSIDSMFPIGRGQRELIIGDRQTGKTAIAIDTILNQKGKDMICIYVAIGQKASSVAQIAELLRRLCRIDGIEWIRLHYAYPTAFPDEVIEVMAREPKICKYLDIPFQHISDDQLAAMHRRHTKAQAYELIDKLRQAIPDLALRTTLLVGYPGETEADFEELLEFVRTVRFERLGVFPYSEEEGTYSARNLPDDVPEEVKQSRVERVMALQNEISLENNRARIGQLERVIIDSRQGDFYVGRSQYDSPEVDQEILIPAAGRRLIRGCFYQVRITAAEDYDLYGELETK